MENLYIHEFWDIEKELLPKQTDFTFAGQSNADTYLLNKKLALSKNAKKQTSNSVYKYASLVPNLIIGSDSSLHACINPCVAVIMFVDISGFTPLSEKCANSGNDGVYKLTSIINDYFSKMVNVIYDLGGDIWKFSGDAFLAVWKVEMSDHIGLLTHKALFCAFHIQQNLGMYYTDFGVILQVKIGMAVGNVIWKMVGDNTSRRAAILGTPVVEVREAESLCVSGDIIVSASLWTHISPNDLVYQELKDGKFFKVFNIIGCLGLQSPKLLQDLGITTRYAASTKSVRDFSKLSNKEELCTTLRTYIMPLVAQQIDADLHLKYINELRILTLMFINIIPRPKRLDTEFMEIVDSSYNVINSVVQNAGGLMEKFSLFDKDIVFLTVFGLRGVCDSEIISACLHSGYDIRDECASIAGIQTISVGITTGLAYCGVVGHPLRREFTVMGPAVNKAARIMCAFPNVVTCDEATYTAAQLPSYYFTQHRQRRFKGFSSDDTSYEFVADKMSILQSLLSSGMPPLLGRSKEMELFRNVLKSSQKATTFKSIGIVGERKCGKTRLLDEMIIDLKKTNMAPSVVELRKCHVLLPYGTAIHILCHALQLSKEMDTMELRTTLKTMLEDNLTATELPMVDDLFDYEYSNCNPRELKVSAVHKRIYVLAFQEGMEQNVLALDDVHYCDEPSRQLIVALIESRLKLVIFTIAHKDALTLVPQIDTLIQLQPLDYNYIPPLACQILHTQAIEVQIVRFLETRCNGHVGWCKTYLESLQKNKYISINEIGRSILQTGHVLMPKAKLLTLSHIVAEPSVNVQLLNLKRQSEEISIVEFNYQNFINTLRVMNQQKWCIRIQKSQTDNRQVSIQPDAIEVKSQGAYKNINLRKLSKDWPSLILNMFSAGSETSGEDSVSIYTTYDKSLITESVLFFDRSKSQKSDQKLDVKLDTLKIQQNMQRFPEIKVPTQSDDTISETSERLVSDSSNKLLVDNIENCLNDTEKILCITTVVDLDLEVKLDSQVNFLSIFDNLRPFEQLVSKCAAIIGTTFNRPTLDAILHYPDYSLTSITIMRLIDLNILYCTKTLKEESTKKCECEHLLPDLSLPYYAFCMNLGFRYPGFRTIVYNILPPNQREMFHRRAVDCLANEHVLCASCAAQEQQSVDTGFRRRSSLAPNLSNYGFSVQQRSAMFMKLSQTVLNVRWRNMIACTCFICEFDRLDNVIRHCEAAGLTGDFLKYKIKYAKACIRNKSHLEAGEIAKFLLIKIKTDPGSLTLEEKKEFIAEAKILLGEVSFEDKNLNAATTYFLEALRGILPGTFRFKTWPYLRVSLLLFSKIWRQKKKQRLVEVAAKALKLIAKILMIKKKYKDAIMVNSISLDILKEKNSLTHVCRAYANQIDILISLQETLDDFNSEREMINKVATIMPAHSIHEALAVGSLIHAAYLRRTMGAGDLLVGLNLLQAMLNLTQSLPATSSRELLAVEYVQLLTLLGHIREAVTQIMQFRTKDSLQLLCYHVLCLDFYRITGCWIEDTEATILFIEITLKNEASLNTPVHHRAGIVLQLWTLWTNPRSVTSEIKVPTHPQPVRNITDCMFRIEEFMALALQANVPAANLDKSKTTKSLKIWTAEVGIMANKYKIMLPSYLYIKAFISYRLENNLPRAEQMLAEALQIAIHQGNELIATRIGLTEEAWRTSETPSSRFLNTKGVRWGEWHKEEWKEILLPVP